MIVVPIYCTLHCDMKNKMIKKTMVFDKKYDKCLQDIRKKDILGTYRIKQIKKIDLAKNRTSVV